MFNIFALGGDGVVEIFLHHQRADRHTICGAEPGILYVNTDCNLRVVVGGKAYECRMVLAVGVLSRTGLAGHGHILEVGKAAGASEHGHAHTFGYINEMLSVDGGDALLGYLFREYGVLYLFYDMWGDKPSAVGYRGTEVGYLERGGKYLTLADCNGYYCVGAPSPLSVDFVVELCVGYESASFAR